MANGVLVSRFNRQHAWLYYTTILHRLIKDRKWYENIIGLRQFNKQQLHVSFLIFVLMLCEFVCLFFVHLLSYCALCFCGNAEKIYKVHSAWSIFHAFEFHSNRLKNVGAVGGRNFGLPIDLAHRLYNCLLLPHKPWLQDVQGSSKMAPFCTP